MALPGKLQEWNRSEGLMGCQEWMVMTRTLRWFLWKASVSMRCCKSFLETTEFMFKLFNFSALSFLFCVICVVFVTQVRKPGSSMQRVWPWALRLLRLRREPETWWMAPSTGLCLQRWECKYGGFPCINAPDEKSKVKEMIDPQELILVQPKI